MATKKGRKNSDYFEMYSRRNKRKILIVEDMELNREILGAMLEGEFELLFAENGKVGLELLSKYFKEISLVILDIYMPECNGFEFLEIAGKDPLLSMVPIIVATSSDGPDDEIKCLDLGAADFITKPYNPEITSARVHSIIKLKESMTALSIVENDNLTGVYTMSAFYHHAGEALRSSNGEIFDLSVLDIKDFKLINSVFGEKTGNELLVYMASFVKKMLPESIVGRQGDKFYGLYPSKYRLTKADIREGTRIVKENPFVPNLLAKIGTCEDIDKNESLPLICDKAVLAIASIKNDSNKIQAIFNTEIENKLLMEQHMEMAFEDAIKNNEFVIWYQPKVDAHTEKVVAAEALVRWVRQNGNIISPKNFIPLFERNGLISILDRYVFEKVCNYQKKRIEAGKNIVPISVNLSRSSIYRYNVVQTYIDIIEKAGIPKALVPIELTESATLDGTEIKQLAMMFSNHGFIIHMDDFGTGYSSLSGLVSMPFDVLKIDKSLIDHIGSNKGDTLVRHVINFAQEIGIKIVAEGVENKLQVDFLKSIGCDQIQGYYYSPPRDLRPFEVILDENGDKIIINLAKEYNDLKLNENRIPELDNKSLLMLTKLSENMMEGFFIYRATTEETILFANQEMYNIFRCKNAEEFKVLTGNSFRGIVHPDEYEEIENSIFEQINHSADDMDVVDYHIIRNDGTVGFVHDKGYCVHTEAYGNIFYVFVKETDNGISEKEIYDEFSRML